MELHGHESWELDALAPATLAQIVRESVDDFTDQGLLDSALDREEQDKARRVR